MTTKTPMTPELFHLGKKKKKKKIEERRERCQFGSTTGREDYEYMAA